MTKKFPLLAATALSLAGFAATPALAQSTWNYATFAENTGSGSNAGSYGNSYSTTLGGTRLTVSAFSSTGSGSTFATANLANYGAGSGFGVRNQTEGLNIAAPNHAMDNYAATDMLALKFTDATTAAAVNVAITSLTTGWHNTSTANNATCGGGACGTDADISLLRWAGSSGPTIVGGTLSSLLSAGWVLVNNYANMTDDASRATGASTSNGSSWWLISAYNSGWGTGSNTTNLSNGDDFVKVLASVSTVAAGGSSNGRLPEPGSLALAGAALLGLYGVRRRAAKRG